MFLDRPYVGDLSASDRAQLGGKERDDGDRFSIQRHEFDFESLSAPMDENDGADVAFPQALTRQVFR